MYYSLSDCLVYWNRLRYGEIVNTFSKAAYIVSAVLVLSVVGLLDYLTGYEISFSIFYLIPIAFLAWYTNKTYGLYIALLASIVWLIVDLLSERQTSSQIVNLWNAFVRLGFFVMVVYLVSLIKKSNVELEKKVKEHTADLTAEINERRKTQSELQSTTNKLRQLAIRMQAIREDENTLIAREIHDELGQALTAIKIDAAWLAKRYSKDPSIVEGLTNIAGTVDDTIKTVRRISTRLRPRLLDQLGLVPAVEWQVKEYQKKTGIECDLIKPDEEIALGSNVSTALFRIFQEALTNISRHAEASHICVSIFVTPSDELQMTVTDDGIGLPGDYLNKSYSLGILGMQERANTIGAAFEIRRAPEGGTEINVKVPLNEKRQ